MYLIADYDELYRPYDRSGGELKHPDFVKLPAKPRGEGLQRLLEHKRGLEVFAIWCLLLEKTTAEKKPENRGKLLNHREQEATISDVAKGIGLKNKDRLVSYALSLLIQMGWVNTNKPSEATSANFRQLPLNISKDNISKDKDKVRKFIPPTLQQINEYIHETGYLVDSKKFLDYFTTSGWVDSNGKKVRSWKQKIITWSGGDRREKLKPQKCIRCDQLGVYIGGKDDTGHKYWLCENHKPTPKPFPADIPIPVMKGVPEGVDINLSRTKNLRALRRRTDGGTEASTAGKEK